jgi:glutamate carboxypeptidase
MHIRMSFFSAALNIAMIVALGMAPFSLAQTPTAIPALSPLESRMAATIDANSAADRVLLEQLVDINSGTMHLAGVVAVKDLLAPRLQTLGFRVRWVPMDTITQRAGDLTAEHPCAAGAGHCGKRLLLIGHMDTVFEPSSSFQRYAPVADSAGKVATGPGVADMKGGLVIMLAALNAMKQAGALDNSEIRIVLSGDEERAGAPIDKARHDMIDAAKQSDVALEFEPSLRRDGQDTISIARRSSTMWHIEATGLSGHSSQIFGEHFGYGAIYELTRILDGFRTQLPEDGLTYNVGLLLGGATAQMNPDKTGGEATGKDNVIPPAAIAYGDLRTVSNEQTTRVEDKMRAIIAQHLPKTDAKIAFTEGYPAMAVTPAGQQLLREWSDASVALGLGPVAEAGPMTRGAGDISFVASFLPGLVGVGALGQGAHAEGETIFLDSLTSQAKRNAVVMERLTNSPPATEQSAR